MRTGTRRTGNRSSSDRADEFCVRGSARLVFSETESESTIRDVTEIAMPDFGAPLL
jgi:hypothetical protein